MKYYKIICYFVFWVFKVKVFYEDFIMYWLNKRKRLGVGLKVNIRSVIF